MTPYETRLIELMERIDATLDELRSHIAEGPALDPVEAIEAFADEAFRARDS